MVNIYLMSQELYYREGFITPMPKKDKSYLVIDNFNRIDVDIFQTYINVLEGYEVTLPRYNKDGSMIKWSKIKILFIILILIGILLVLHMTL